MSEMLKQLQETAAWLDERVPEKPAIALVKS